MSGSLKNQINPTFIGEKSFYYEEVYHHYLYQPGGCFYI